MAPTRSAISRFDSNVSTAMITMAVRAVSATSLTGPRSVEVKCSVIWLATSMRTTPVSTA